MGLVEDPLIRPNSRGRPPLRWIERRLASPPFPGRRGVRRDTRRACATEGWPVRGSARSRRRLVYHLFAGRTTDIVRPPAPDDRRVLVLPVEPPVTDRTSHRWVPRSAFIRHNIKHTGIVLIFLQSAGPLAARGPNAPSSAPADRYGDRFALLSIERPRGSLDATRCVSLDAIGAAPRFRDTTCVRSQYGSVPRIARSSGAPAQPHGEAAAGCTVVNRSRRRDVPITGQRTISTAPPVESADPPTDIAKTGGPTGQDRSTRRSPCRRSRSSRSRRPGRRRGERVLAFADDRRNLGQSARSAAAYDAGRARGVKPPRPHSKP